MGIRTVALALAALVLAGAAAHAQKPARNAPAGGLAAFERENDRACYRRIERARFEQRLAQLRTAAADERAFYTGAPGTILTAARFARERDDFAAALRDYDGLLAALPADDSRREPIARERAAVAEEQSLVSTGIARPPGGWLLATIIDAPGPAGASYRIGVWVRPNCSAFGLGDGESALQLYRPTGATPPLAKAGDLVRGAPGMSLLANDDLWGNDLLGEGRRLIAFDEANGGNCESCSRLRLFLAEADGLRPLLVDAPAFVVPRTIETIGDGRRALIASDARWAFFGGTCHACSPGVAVTFSWTGDRFTATCRESAEFFRRTATELTGRTADSAEDRFGAITSALLARLQAGDGDQAWTDYRTALADLRKMPRVRRNAYADAERQLGDALRAGRAAMAQAACPVNAMPIAPQGRRRG